jgi:hypothetical protein
MFEIETDITLHATTEKVWEVLTDFEQYGTWNPFMTKVVGTAEKNRKLRVEMELADSRGFLAKPKITVCESGSELRWVSRLYFKGLYDAEHYFTLEELGKHRVKLVHGEKYSGSFAKSLFKKLSADNETGFRIMNQALKKRLKELAADSGEEEGA